MLLLLADTTAGYSLAVAITSLGLFVISVPFYWSLMKLSVKPKIVQRTFVGKGQEKRTPSRVAGEILSFFTRNNFVISDRGETVTGADYWKRASRKEQIKMKMMVGDDGTLSKIIVQGDNQQEEQLKKELQLCEKGMFTLKESLTDEMAVANSNNFPFHQFFGKVNFPHVM